VLGLCRAGLGQDAGLPGAVQEDDELGDGHG
jgi:hypothetical protein